MVLNYDENKMILVMKFKNEIKGNVLDIGCNEGKTAEFMIKKDNMKYFGIDVDKSALNKAKKNKLKVKYVDLNKNKLPFKNNSFDTILILDILEHILEPIKILEESKRILKEDGKIILSLPNDYYLTNFLRMFLLNKPIVFETSFFQRGGHIHFFTINLSKKLVSKLFKIEKINYLGNNISVPFLNQKLKNSVAKISPRFFASNIILLLSKKHIYL